MPYSNKHKEYMQEALKLARTAFDLDEIPIGALVVNKNGDIIGTGYNMVEIDKNQNSHAEIIAIKNATKVINDWRLNDCTLYVTLQPCMMCMGLIFLSRIKYVIYGANSPIFGCFIDKELLPDLYKKQDCFIVPGILAEESQQLIQSFFYIKREGVNNVGSNKKKVT